MKKLVIMAAFVWSSLASADIIRCNFTEPFFSTEYSMAQQRLTVTYAENNRRVVMNNVSFQIIGPAQFEVWSRGRAVLQKLNLNFIGSDGMSDLLYPYDVEFNGQRGGCSSNFLHPHNP